MELMMTTKIDIVSGFLGAGKTTLINKILKQVLPEEKTAIIENEFGEIGIDGQILGAHGIEIREISSGCICCTLFGDFILAMKELLTQVQLDRVIIEPTGIGRLSDILNACKNVNKEYSIELNMIVSVVDCMKFEMYSQMFGDFFRDQIQIAKTIFLSRTQLCEEKTISSAEKAVRQINKKAQIISTPWEQMTGADILNCGQDHESTIIEDIITNDIFSHHHSDDDIFDSWSMSTLKRYSRDNFNYILDQLQDKDKYGDIYRGKGIFQTPDGSWLRFDYVPGEIHFKKVLNVGEGKIVIIGKDINKSALNVLIDS
jgi:G3E family GTPase